MSWRDKFRSRRRGGDGFNEVDRDILYHLLERVNEMTDIVSRLKDDVAQQTTLISSVITLLNGVAERIRAATDAEDGADEQELSDIADELEQNSTALAQAVQSNTEAAPQPIDGNTANQSQSGTATLGAGDGTSGGVIGVAGSPDSSTSQQSTTDQPTSQPVNGTDTTTGQ